MRIDFSQGLVGFDDEPMTQPVIGKSGEANRADGGALEREPITLQTICINALMTDLESDKKATGVEKVARWDFAQRIHHADGPLDLKPKEITDLQERIGQGFGPAIVGPAFRMLEGDGKNE